MKDSGFRGRIYIINSVKSVCSYTLNDHYLFYYVTGRDNHFVSTLWSFPILFAYKELN